MSDGNSPAADFKESRVRLEIQIYAAIIALQYSTNRFLLVVLLVVYGVRGQRRSTTMSIPYLLRSYSRRTPHSGPRGVACGS